jgi:hypothetical protein
METMCKHCDELTNKVTNLEAVGTIPTEAPKKKNSIFDMPKKMHVLLATIYVF